MKKLVLTIAIVLGVTLGAAAQERGLFDRGPEGYQSSGNNRTAESLLLPTQHGSSGDQPTSSPIGGGALLLIGFGAAYALKKRSKK